MYVTTLLCPNCGYEHRMVADNVVADRDRLREQLEALRDAAQKFVDAYPGGQAGALGNGAARRAHTEFKSLLEESSE